MNEDSRGDIQEPGDVVPTTGSDSLARPNGGTRSTARESLRPRAALVEEPTVISASVGSSRARSTPAPAAPASTHEIGRSLEGSRLHNFQLDRFVGGGGMGAVFQATDLDLNRSVAVKVLTHRCDDATVRRFRVEAQSAARLNHDNIARVFMVGESQGWNYIVFEFVEGENLRDLVARQGPLSLQQAMSVFGQIASAIEHAASQEVVHRDVKPSNILLTPDGRAKLVDMGLARLRLVESESAELTASGVTLGTFDYISPEQGHDPRNADVRSDLYSLGCTMYYVLTGQPPFPEGSPLQKLLKHAGEMPRDPRELRTDLPEEIGQVLLRLLAKQPELRYQSARDLLMDLRRVTEALGISFPTIHVAPAPAPREGRLRWTGHLPWIVPLGLLLLVWLLLQWNALHSNPTLPPMPRYSGQVERSEDTSANRERAPDEPQPPTRS